MIFFFFSFHFGLFVSFAASLHTDTLTHIHSLVATTTLKGAVFLFMVLTHTAHLDSFI